MVTLDQQQIYNNHLVASRKVKGEAFRIRKDFSDLEADKVMFLEKLTRLFKNCPSIDQEVFFTAPHKIYPEDAYYPLEFFTTQKAIKCYTQYVKLLEIQDPDSPDSLKRLQESLKFVYQFCKEKNLKLSDYELNIEGSMPCFVDHLKNHKINYYTLHALTFRKPQIDSRILTFIFPEFFEVFQKTKNKFFSSTKMKEFAKQAKQKLETKLNTNNK